MVYREEDASDVEDEYDVEGGELLEDDEGSDYLEEGGDVGEGEEAEEEDDEEEDLLETDPLESLEVRHTLSAPATHLEGFLSEARLSKYEMAYLKGARWTQLLQGAPPTVDTTGCTSEREIMEREFQMGKIPLAILRTLRGKKGVLAQHVMSLSQMNYIQPSEFFFASAASAVSEPTEDTPGGPAVHNKETPAKKPVVRRPRREKTDP